MFPEGRGGAGGLIVHISGAHLPPRALDDILMRPREGEGRNVIEYPRQHILTADGTTRSCSSTSGFIKWVVVGVGVGGKWGCFVTRPPHPTPCVCEALLCVRLAPALGLANLTAAPALLTTALIYAIMELIRVINSAQARGRAWPPIHSFGTAIIFSSLYPPQPPPTSPLRAHKQQEE